MSEKPLIIKGPLNDLSDVLRVSRVQAKILLRVDRVRIKPVVYPYGQSDYLVVAEPDGSGCSKSSDVGGKREKTKT